MEQKEAKTQNWVSVLNEHSEWRGDADMLKWFAALIERERLALPEDALQSFSDALCQMRRIVYDSHFGNDLDLSWLNRELGEIRLSFDWPAQIPGFPLLHNKTNSKNEKDLLESLRGALIVQFAADLAESLSSGSRIGVQRCEGLYRDNAATKLSMVPEIADKDEYLWRQEIPVLVEKALEEESEIQRCADLFEASSRSKFCSDKCRFTTFQIIKQLKEPNYLAEKQRRYRQKKS